MKTITDIINKKDSTLNKLIKKLDDSQELAAVFRSVIDKNLAKNCQFANYKKSVLTVTVTNASWATRLRYMIPELIKQLQTQPEFKDITKIRYTITTTKNPAAKPKDKPAKLSSKNETLWKKTIAELNK